MVEEGLGLDVAGGGEILTALKAGVDPALIVLHGNAKSDEEIAMAVDHGLGLVVVDNSDDVDRLEATVPSGRTQDVLVRIIPGVTADTHAAVLTGHAVDLACVLEILHSGGHTVGVAASQASRALPSMLAILGWHSCDHLGPVREGDTLRTTLDIERLEPLADGGLAHVGASVTADRAAGPEKVLDWRFVAAFA